MEPTEAVGQQEQAKYQRAWNDPAYRQACHSLSLWESHRDWFPKQFETAIDLGCGLGHLYAFWNTQGVEAYGFDIAVNCLHPVVAKQWGHRFVYGCLWEMKLGRKFDFGICADVMEHIPPAKVDATLRCMGQHCDELLFKIAHEPNKLGNEVLHLTLQPATWWVTVMQAVGGKAELLGKVNRSGFLDSIVRWLPKGGT